MLPKLPGSAQRTPEEKRAYCRAYYLKNRERVIAATKAWRLANLARDNARRRALGPEKRRRASLRWNYGITPEQFAAERDKRGGLCDICKNPPNGKGHHAILHVDHDHRTNTNRGLLCGRCNLGLGLFLDDEDRLAAAIVYLRGHAQRRSQEA